MAGGFESIVAWRTARKAHPPLLLRYRSSYLFILTTVSIAIFTDIFLYAVIVPVIPFALSVRVGVAEHDGECYENLFLPILMKEKPSFRPSNVPSS